MNKATSPTLAGLELVTYMDVHPLVLFSILKHNTHLPKVTGLVIGSLLGKRDGSTRIKEIKSCSRSYSRLLVQKWHLNYVYLWFKDRIMSLELWMHFDCEVSSKVFSRFFIWHIQSTFSTELYSCRRVKVSQRPAFRTPKARATSSHIPVSPPSVLGENLLGWSTPSTLSFEKPAANI